MKARKDVVDFIENQSTTYSNRYWNLKHEKVHYGLQELKDLLDFIYGESPYKEEEYIRGVNDRP